MMRYLLSFFFLISLFGCSKTLPPIGTYISLSTITSNGVAKDEENIKKLEGKVVQVWGFIDPSNIFTEENCFSLFALKDDDIGMGVNIELIGDKFLYINLFEKLNGLGERRVEVLLQGVLKLYKRNYNFNSSLGVTIEVTTPNDIRIKGKK